MSKEEAARKACLYFFPSIETGDRASARSWTHENARWSIGEKVDGSQLSFRLSPENVDVDSLLPALGTRMICDLVREYCNEVVFSIHARTLRGTIDSRFADATFGKAVRMIQGLSMMLDPALTYHGECVQRLCQNRIEYNRLPRGYCVLYDIQDHAGRFFWPQEIQAEADRIGLECVQILAQGREGDDLDAVREAKLLQLAIDDGSAPPSMLGGKMEGLVLNHSSYKKLTNGVVETHATKLKFVSRDFKESRDVPRTTSSSRFLLPDEFVSWLGAQWDAPARVHKATQHLREAGAVEPLSLSEVCAELDSDLLKERRGDISRHILAEYDALVCAPAEKATRMLRKMKHATHDCFTQIVEAADLAAQAKRAALEAHFIPLILVRARQCAASILSGVTHHLDVFGSPRICAEKDDRGVAHFFSFSFAYHPT